MARNRLMIVAALAASWWAVSPQAVIGGEPPRGDRHWPTWRGPGSTGVAPEATPPVEWGEDRNIQWKVSIPGRGHATPIVWGDRVYIQTSVELLESSPEAEASPPRHDSSLDSEDSQPDGPRPRGRGGRRPGGRRGGFWGGPASPQHPFEFRVMALDRGTGQTVWSRTVRTEKPHESGHTDSSQASNSPVTDGEHVYAYFGSRGLYCLTPDGQVKWEKQLGQMQTRNEFGEGSSPALHGNTLVIAWDHEGDDFVAAFDKRSGAELWRVSRDEPTSWCTPVVVEANGKPQVVLEATNATRAYDLKTGKEVWRCSGMTQNAIPTPIVAGELLYAISGFRGAACLAIDYSRAKGDITDGAAIRWRYDRSTPYVPSGVVYGGRLYFVENNKPLLTCLNAKTGKRVYDQQRLRGIDSIYASMVAAGGHVYIAGRNGTTMVLKDGPAFKVAAINALDDGFDASPAAVGGALFLRGRSNLYCISEQ